MNVQKVQSTNTNSAYFKASFINDSNGYLRKLWQEEIKTDLLKEQIDKFYYTRKGHNIEITNLQNNINGCLQVLDFFNHRTGKSGSFESQKFKTLSSFFENVFKGKFDNIFTEDSQAKTFQKLSGQKINTDFSGSME